MGRLHHSFRSVFSMESVKAQMLIIHLRGEAQKLLSSLTESQLGDYSKLKTTLTDRYDPKEKESLYRCQFRQFKREKGVSSSDYGYALSKLAQKAYPKLTLHQLEVHVVDQFINGLGHHELQKHVQFKHPQTLQEAIGLATEFEALEGPLDRVKKPSEETTTVAPIAFHNNEEIKPSQNITLDQISQLIDTKLDIVLPRQEIRDRGPSIQRDKSPYRHNDRRVDFSPSRQKERYRDLSPSRQNDYSNHNSYQSKANPRSPSHTKRKMYCSYCHRTNHNIESCYFRKNSESNIKDKEIEPESSYAITSNSSGISQTIPTITITPSTDNKDIANNLDKNDTTYYENCPETKTPDLLTNSQNNHKNEVNPISSLQQNVQDEVSVNTSPTSCLYLQATVKNQASNFLIDTGSPYSIMSNKIFNKFAKENNWQIKADKTRLRADDGNIIKTYGRVCISLTVEGRRFNQEFIIANIQ